MIQSVGVCILDTSGDEGHIVEKHDPAWNPEILLKGQSRPDVWKLELTSVRKAVFGRDCPASANFVRSIAFLIVARHGPNRHDLWIPLHQLRAAWRQVALACLPGGTGVFSGGGYRLG